MTHRLGRRRRGLALMAGAAIVLALGGCDGGSSSDGSADAPPTSGVGVSTSVPTGPVPVGVATTVPATTSSVPVRSLPWAGPPEVREVDDYAAGLGITIDEAERRNALVEALQGGDVAQWLDRRREFYWVEETDDSWLLVIGRERLNRRFAEKLAERLAGTPLDGTVEIRQVDHDLAALERIEERMIGAIQLWCLPPATSFEVDYAANRVVMGVQSLDEFRTAAESAEIRLSDGLEVEARPIKNAPGADTEPCEAPLRALEGARDRWAARDAHRYAYDMTVGSAWFPSRVVAEVSVWDGAVQERIPSDLPSDDSLYPSRFATRYGTIEELFDIVASYPVQWLTVTYDATWGFPTSLRFDMPSVIDEEWSWRIDGFRTLETEPEPAPPRAPRGGDWSLQIERFPWGVVIVDAVVGPVDGVARSEWGWRHTLDVTEVVYTAPGSEPIEVGAVEVADTSAPRALLHQEGNSVRIVLWQGRSDRWMVFAVVEATDDGLRFVGPPARNGFNVEIAYLCHYPRREIPTDPPPMRDAAAEFDLLTRWLDERGFPKPNVDKNDTSGEALRRVCETGQPSDGAARSRPAGGVGALDVASWGAGDAPFGGVDQGVVAAA